MSTVPQHNFQPVIQGLRALAVISVIIFHYDSELLPGGFVGVDIFFVISGYLMTEILLKKKIEKNYSSAHALRYFYIGRFKRIAPAYFVLLIVVSTVSAVVFIPSDFAFYADSLDKAVYFFSNHYFSNLGGYFAPNTEELPLLHTWSLAVEMQFYFILPIIVLFLPVSFLKPILPLALVLGSVVVEYCVRYKGWQSEAYFSLFARIPEFLVGSCLALHSVWIKNNVKSANAIGLMAAMILGLSFCLINSEVPFPGLITCVLSLATAALIATPESPVSRLLSLPLLVWIGGISYSLYLWHWPILAFIRYYTGSYQLDIFNTVVFVISTSLIAIASYYIIEQKFRKPQNSLLATFGIVSLTAAVWLYAPTFNENLIEPLPVELTRYANPDEICHGSIIGTCLRGAENNRPSILALGDSHGAMLNNFYDKLGEEVGVPIRVITASSCVTIPGFDIKHLESWAQEPCMLQIEAAKKFLDKAHVVIIAGMWSYQTESPGFTKALVNFLKVSTMEGKKVFILSQVPLFEKSPLRAYRFSELGLSTVPARSNEYVHANELIRALANEQPGVTFVDLTGLKVFEKAPLFDGGLIYHDKSHLNEAGARRYAEDALKLKEYLNAL